MKQVTISLYSFDELDQKAKQKATNEHSAFLDSQPEQYENEDGEMIDEYYEHSEEDTIDNILANDYVFFQDGSLAHCTTYTGKHQKAGITEFHFKGTDFIIN